MNIEDKEWLSKILERSHWLFYGELEIYLNQFLKLLLAKDKPFAAGINEELSTDLQVAYWSVLSELNHLELIEYGVSPRFPWLTKDGEKFKQLVLGNENAIQEACDYTYDQTH